MPDRAPKVYVVERPREHRVIQILAQPFEWKFTEPTSPDSSTDQAVQDAGPVQKAA